MLTEERQQFILDTLASHQFLTLQQLTEYTNCSASTIRRDLNKLQQEEKLTRVHGGAKLIDERKELELVTKRSQNTNEKIAIAQIASRLINDGDYIYLDAGSTTLEMIPFIKAQNIKVVTNGLTHVEKLLSEGIDTIVVGGEVKTNTLAITGARATQFIENYHFDKVFLGVNGVDIVSGLSTPDEREALVKESAMKQGQQTYVLADTSKFGEVHFSTIHENETPIIITNPSTYHIEHFEQYEKRYEFLGGHL
ncbi:DeoR/GlpR family DNA-binding transcription regulator [Staphylococcus canis]|uniref:DeoR/GlpR transcriptional regulator n=1 Tax=Staphylococcus canis TaxID=2724942 RepID=A0ABS0T7U9_9STAP|nr:DeoR/GlpR transcriptional regulator [Staphylococcus canis]